MVCLNSALQSLEQLSYIVPKTKEMTKIKIAIWCCIFMCIFSICMIFYSSELVDRILYGALSLFVFCNLYVFNKYGYERAENISRAHYASLITEVQTQIHHQPRKIKQKVNWAKYGF